MVVTGCRRNLLVMDAQLLLIILTALPVTPCRAVSSSTGIAPRGLHMNHQLNELLNIKAPVLGWEVPHGFHQASFRLYLCADNGTCHAHQCISASLDCSASDNRFVLQCRLWAAFMSGQLNYQLPASDLGSMGLCI